MKILSRYLLMICAAALLYGCSTEREEPEVHHKGVPAYAEVTLGDIEAYPTRSTKNNYDQWSIATFDSGDVVGMYATTGRQNPYDPDDLDNFSFPVWNEPMYYEGRSGNSYRFGNAEVVIDPPQVSTSSGYNYSSMYYPYYKDMPDPNVYLPTDRIRGLTLRSEEEEDGIARCKDLMLSSSTRITLTEGVLRPSFKHFCFNLVLQRGSGFEHPDDPSIWVVMRDPFTDARITRYQYTNTMGEFQWTLQNIPEEGEQVWGRIKDDLPGFDVNKYAVWQAWEGAPYKGTDSYYVLLPPKEVMFIMIQDNYGEWHNVTDFYIGSVGSKAGTGGTRYVLNISLVGLDVVVKPVSIENWDEETTITDNRKVGINNFAEYNDWVTVYNTYVNNSRNSTYHDMLLKYGDGLQVDGGETRWRFYINSDLDFAGHGDVPKILRLEDVLEGSSTYTNYTISNLKSDLIDEMGPTGELRALDFKGLYVIQQGESANFFGALVNVMTKGLIENCNIINGVVVANDNVPVGMLAGSIEDGRIIDCNISGDAIGAKSYEIEIDGQSVSGLFGVLNGTPQLTRVHTTGLKFISK